MAENKLQIQYDELTKRLKSLCVKFIDTHKDPLEAPDQYDLDVQSYCILSHAGFEEFFESICIYILSTIDSNFNLPSRNISIGTICLLHFDCASQNLDDKWDSNGLLNDYLYKKITERKSVLSKYAIDGTHGADIKYLKKLLLPIGIDIPHDVNYVNALEKLKDIRGTYAHSFSRAKKTTSPEDAKAIVNDVLRLAQNLKDQAINMKFFPTK